MPIDFEKLTEKRRERKMFELAPQQQEASDRIKQWYSAPDEPFFYLGGWAGTGKTSIAKTVAVELCDPSKIVYAAYTGKAAHVMRQNGCNGAGTCHSVIYHSATPSGAELERHKEELELLCLELKDAGHSEQSIASMPMVSQINEKIAEEEYQMKTPRFRKNPDSILKAAKLSIIDEVSMLGQKMGEDWLSFGVKTLVLGDPAQLPAIGGEGYFTKHDPHFMLTDIHRQALDNPILQIATAFREKRYPDEGWYGESRIVDKDDLSPSQLRELVMSADQIIVGKNDKRHAINQRVRQLKGINEPYPIVGERVVCLRNDNEEGLLNGAVYEVVEAAKVDEFDNQKVSMMIQAVGSDTPQEVLCHVHHFEGFEREQELSKMFGARMGAQQFGFAYAMTCHKMQGSQAGRVLIFDQSFVARGDKYRWLYTAATRAVDSCTVLR